MKHRHVARRVASAVTLLLASVMTAAPAPAHAQQGAQQPQAAAPVPPGFRAEPVVAPAEGLVHQRLVRDADPQVVQVARLTPGKGLALRAVLSNERIAGSNPRLERTSAMCQRVECLVAINGDFAKPGEHAPVGAVVAAGELVRSPNQHHHQLSIRADGSLTTEWMAWTGTIVATDLQSIGLDGVNVPRTDGALMLYTERYGATTATNGHGVEMVLTVSEPAGPLRLGATSVLVATDLRDAQPATRLSPGTVVLSGHGAKAQALRDLWQRMQSGAAGTTVLARLESSADILQSIGGTPVLVREGKRWVADDGTGFVSGRHPRTVVGWTSEGEVLLVTVDGRQPGRSGGMTLVEAADLMLSLGAVEAINLDGGGSSTFVAAGEVLNRPSDQMVRRGGGPAVVHRAGVAEEVVGYVERPVVSALAVVPVERAVVPMTPAPLASQIDLPPTTAAEPAADPGSNPSAGFPALVWALPPEPVTGLPTGVVLAAVLALMLSATATGAATRLRPALVSDRRDVRSPGPGPRSPGRW